MWMGNRGLLHDPGQSIRRAWQVKRWLICVLQFRGRQRTVMAPGRYTELFFLDEATALAAGHRPCAECRHQRFKDFCSAWASGNPTLLGSEKLTVSILDNQLHQERIAPGRAKRMFRANLDDLPEGAFVTAESWEGIAYLVRTHSLLAWSPGGYRGAVARPQGMEVSVLTPPSTIEAIRAGYAPELHLSATAW
jgi:hypothetical protein